MSSTSASPTRSGPARWRRGTRRSWTARRDVRSVVRGDSMPLLKFLLGRRLASHEQAERKLGVVAGIPALGLDGLASSSYGPEAALAMLIPLGAAGLAYIGPVVAAILLVLVILY